MSHTASGNVLVELVCSLSMGAAADAPPDAPIASASAPARTRASFPALTLRTMARPLAALKTSRVQLIRRNRADRRLGVAAPQRSVPGAFMFPLEDAADGALPAPPCRLVLQPACTRITHRTIYVASLRQTDSQGCRRCRLTLPCATAR